MGILVQKDFQTVFVAVPKLVGSYQPREDVEKKNPREKTLTIFHVWPCIEKRHYPDGDKIVQKRFR